MMKKDLSVLYLRPGADYKHFDLFMSEKIVTIGYDLTETNYFELTPSKRAIRIRAAILRRKSGATEQGIKSKLSRYEAFFDLDIHYGIFPDPAEPVLYVVRFTGETVFRTDAFNEHCHGRIFDQIFPIANLNAYMPRQGICEANLELIPGLRELLSGPIPDFNWMAKDEPDLTGLEGEQQIIMSEHLRRERDHGFVRKYKKKYKDVICCPACGMDLAARYGLPAINLLELHHIVPLHTRAGSYQIKEEDVTLLCPTCHRAIHRMMAENDGKMLAVEEFCNRVR